MTGLVSCPISIKKKILKDKKGYIIIQMVVNYQNGKIYQMTSPSGKVYIGSTCESLAVRKAKHKAHYNKWKKDGGNYTYVTSFELFEENPDNVEIILIEFGIG